jgi:hypothetical protein
MGAATVGVDTQIILDDNLDSYQLDRVKTHQSLQPRTNMVLSPQYTLKDISDRFSWSVCHP